jgi:hypothetical protein
MTIVVRSLLVIVLFLASVPGASADCTCVSLRTFMPEERGRFEEQYGIEWWKVIGLIPGPAQPGDWAERHSGEFQHGLHAAAVLGPSILRGHEAWPQVKPLLTACAVQVPA